MNENLYIKNLDISFIKKDFIRKGKNEKKIYDYEDYILEFINMSRFVEDNGNTLFEKISHENQSNGECDLKNKKRELELKMMIDSYTVRRMAYYSSGIYEIAKGTICHTASEFNMKNKLTENKKYELYWLIKIFRQYSYEDLIRVSELDECSIIYDRIVKSCITKIEKDKDIIYYFPIDIFYKDKETNKEIAVEIINAINEDLKGVMKFRKNKTDKDTFVCVISKTYIIFAYYSENKKFEYYDMIKTSNSKIFNEIKDINTVWT